jgi:hypothetical protein
VKTHELAAALRRLSDLLKAGPNVHLESLRERLAAPPPMTDSGGIAVNLATLSALSRVPKAQWASFVQEYGLPIRVDPRDSARNVLGKLMRYLERNPAAIDRITQRARHKARDASPELMKALSILLGER